MYNITSSLSLLTKAVDKELSRDSSTRTQILASLLSYSVNVSSCKILCDRNYMYI